MAMILTYKQFKEKVPADTMMFVDRLLPLMRYYVSRNAGIKLKNDNLITNKTAKTLIVMLNALYEFGEVDATFLSAHNYDKSNAKIDMSIEVKDADITEIFNEFCNTFCFLESEKSYQTLTPNQILQESYNQYYKYSNNNYNSDKITYLFGNSSELERYFNALKGTIQRDLESKTGEIRKAVIGDLPIESINYLETVAKIHTLILKKKRNNSYNKNFITNEYTDIYSLARLLAIYHYKDFEYDNGSISDKEAMIEILAKHGVTLESVHKQIGFSISKSEIENEEYKILTLSQTYEKYIRDGINKDKKDEEISVKDIVSNLFEREFNDSLIFERILANTNSYIGMLEDFSEQIDQTKEEQNNLRVLKSINDFYENLPMPTREFMEFTAKTYIYILNKMKEKKHNQSLLSIEDDADTLALFISAHLFDSDISRFFNDNGVGL